ncbi:MAG: HAMP domain-containing protein [Anaerolineales bacterium]|nr:HAMP domain-containing protein [Anaerolineales bacterium]
MSIRFKVILPYLLLTLLVAVTGAYVVTRLVTNSLEERLSNQLFEAGRVVSDSMARREIDHFQDARLVAFTSGLGEALKDGDDERVVVLAKPAAGGLNVESLMVFDAQGREKLHTIKQSDGTIRDVTQRDQQAALPIVEELLAENSPDSLPRRALAQNPVDRRYYYFTAIPIPFGDRVVGVVTVGTSLDTLVPLLKATASADVILYDKNGQALASTLGGNTTDPLFLRTLSIEKDFYDRVIVQDESVEGENFEVEGRFYRSGFSPLRISNDRIAVFAVILPMQFVVESSSVSRNNYVALYSAAMLAVILVGYLIARIIILNPLSSLVRTSRAIAAGDLNRRTGVRTNDEIGVLASAFDAMTENLQERTHELEKTNRVLEQMDRTKVRFIQISAHELRTPLTLVQGYAQMVELKSKGNKDLEKYARGIVSGAERMVGIVDNLLDVSRIDSNLLDVRATDVEIAALVEKAKKAFDASLEERRMNFSVQGLADLPFVKADTELLYKVFYHVIGNAIKYTPDGGSITISGSTVRERGKPPEIEIKVRDTGIGIDPQYHELVFEKFYQTGEVLLHSSGKTKFKGGGPGLGLAISRGIMDAHHGRIWLESAGHDEAKNPGTTVFIRLPIDGHK